MWTDGRKGRPTQVRAVVVGVGEYGAWERRLMVPAGRFATPVALDEAYAWALSLGQRPMWGKVDVLVSEAAGVPTGVTVNGAPSRKALDASLAALCSQLRGSPAMGVLVLAGRGAWHDPGDGGGPRPWFCPSDTTDIAFDGIDLRKLYGRLCAASPDRPLHLALRCGFGVEGRTLTPCEQVLEPILAVRPGDTVTTLRPAWDPDGVTPGGFSVEAGIA